MPCVEPTISSKTVTHSTDVMCWEDLPSEQCAMEFRPPTAMQLCCPWRQGIAHLTKVSCVVGAVFWLTKFVVLPYLTNPWNRLALVGTVAGVLLGALTLVLDPGGKRVRKHNPNRNLKNISWTSALALAGGVVICISPALHLTGALVYASVGLTLLGFLSRQLVCHQVGWHSANPQVAKTRRDQWRAGAQNLRSSLRSDSEDLKNLALEGLGGYAVVGVGLVLQPACYLACEWAGMTTWSWWVPPLTLFTLLAFGKIWVTHSKSSETFELAMGHWFDYEKDGASSPLVYQSPAGSAAGRTVLVWQVVGVLTVGMGALLSNIEFLQRLDVPVDRQDIIIVSLLDTLLAAVTVPWLVWYSLKTITAPALVAARLRHEFSGQSKKPQPSGPKE